VRTGGLIYLPQQDGNMNKRLILDNIELELKQGDRVGLLGSNGAGKTTLLRLMAGILTPDSGTIVQHGEISTFFESDYGMDSNLSGSENAYSRGVIAGLNRQDALRIVDEVGRFAELGEKYLQPLRTYSSGMRSRLSFALEMTLAREILLIDEGFATADRYFQLKTTRHLDEALDKSRLVVLASHSNDVLSRICNKGIVLKDTHILFQGDLDDAIQAYENSISY
jgi:ABC-type polysaccharide/polyol phosphate transport system ATPase subunit